MPFTLAHPAAIVPLKHGRFARWIKQENLVLSALLVGSIIPDLGYFLPGTESSVFTHSLLGVVIIGLPAGLGLLWLYHRLLKFPLLSLLPGMHQKVLRPYCTNFTFLPGKRLLAIILSLFIGALSHIVWDGFTHGQGWAVQVIPFLHETLFQLVGVWVKPYGLLKHGSSTFGIALLAYWYWQWYCDQVGIAPRLSLSAGWQLLLLIGFFGLVIASGILVGYLSYRVGYAAISTFIRWSLLVGLALGLGSRLVFKMTRPSQ